MTGPRPHRPTLGLTHWIGASDADLWQHMVDRGIPADEATQHVLTRRRAMLANTPANIAKELDPGALASFGLGAADMASFGLGDQIARAIEPEAKLTQDLAQQLHPTAHVVGEVAGLLTPIGLERAAAGVGLHLAPSVIGKTVQTIANPAARAAARTAVNALIGGSYAGAQAAGHQEGGLGERAAAAGRAAPLGAAFGVAAPWLLGGAQAAGSKLLGPIVDRVAGAGPVSAIPEVESAAARLAKPPIAGPVADLAAAKADLAAGKITPADYKVAEAMARGQMASATPLPSFAQPLGLLAPQPSAPEAPPAPIKGRGIANISSPQLRQMWDYFAANPTHPDATATNAAIAAELSRRRKQKP